MFKKTETKIDKITRENLDFMETLLDQKDVFIHSLTLDCILKHHCVVCLYKFIPKQTIAKLHKLDVHMPRNLRPETCPRSQIITNNSSSHCGLYLHSDSVLTLGDGDFSFSLSLVRGGHKPSKLCATSYESLQSITSIYQNCTAILQELSSSRVKTYHEVDAADIAATGNIPFAKFDIVVWNFPCVAGSGGSDGQVTEIETNKTLLRKFFSNVGDFLKINGRREVHVTHKTIEPFSWWGLVDIAADCGWTFRGSLLFDRCLYPGYINRKARDKKSFTATDAQTFVFWSPFAENATSSSSPSTSSLLTNDALIRVETILPRLCSFLRQHYSTKKTETETDTVTIAPDQTKKKLKIK